MKNPVTLLLLFICLGSLYAGETIKTYSFDKPSIGEFGDYQIITFENTLLTGKTGEPALPYHEIKLLLPPGEEAISIDFEGINEILIPGRYEIYPQQASRPLSDPGNHEFTINHQIYNSKLSYPYQPTGIVRTEYLNGHAIALASFTPMKYNPATGQVSYYKKVRITITTATSDESVNALQNLNYSGAIRVEKYVQNPALIKDYSYDTKNPDDYHLLIITTNQFEEDFDSIIELYKIRGYRTELVTKETILASVSGQDDAEKIRNYIIQEYQDHNVQYILLGGDVEHIPYRGFYCYVQSGSGYEDSNIPADLYYSALDGSWNDDGDNRWGEIGEDDLLPDIAVARYPFSNLSELNNMINKTISYQDDPVLGELTNALMAGEWLYSNPETWGSDYLELLIGYTNENGYETWGIPEDYNFEKLYEINQSWGGSDLMQAINSGKQFIHHVGHASSNYVAHMYNSDITNSNFSLVNGEDHNFTLMQSHGCICGAFDDNDCIMEKMVTIQNFAVAVIGNSRYGWFNEGQTEGPAQHLHREMVDALYHERINQIGAAFVECKIQTAPWVTAPGQWEEGALRWNFYDINILGDPVLGVWTDEPVDITVDHSGILVMGVTEYEVNVSSDGNPMENFQCAFLYEGELLGTATTDESGNAAIEIVLPETPGEAELVVCGYNCLPNASQVTIIPPGPTYVHYIEHQVDDSQGNDNGEIDYGEMIVLGVTLENVGLETAEGISASLSTSNPYITITDSFEDYGDIVSNGTLLIEDAFAFETGNNIPDQTLIEFQITINWGEGEEEVVNDFTDIANAPSLATGNITVDDTGNGNGNGILDPGESAGIIIEVLNEGHADCETINGVLSSMSNYVSIIAGTCSLNPLSAGGYAMATFEVEMDEDTPTGSTVDLSYDFTSGEYGVSGTYYLPVGLIYEDFETGDFSKFDWMQMGDADWTVVTQNPYEGVYAAKSGSIGDQSESTLAISMEVISDGEISFYKKVSSEANYDYLRFYIDDVLQGEWEGEEDWSQESYAVTSGEHTFKWSYEKDYSVSGGSDCAWLDYIVFPGATGSGAVLAVNATATPEMICFGEATQLQANVTGGTGNYTYVWTPSEYLNDPTASNPIATPQETTLYNVEVDDGDETVNSQVLVTVYDLPDTPVIEQIDDHLVSSASSGNQWYDSNGLIPGATQQEYYPTTTDHYYVEVSSTNGCVSEPSNVIYFIYTGVATYEKNLFSLYPNPAGKKVFVRFNESIDKAEISIRNMLNEIVFEYSGDIRSQEILGIDLSKHSKGVYFVSIRSEKGEITKKLIIH